MKNNLLKTMAIVLLLIGSINAQEIKQITPIRTKLMARNGAVMIDVREKDEIKALAYDVEGILLIPLSDFENYLNEIPKDKDIILACRSGKRSQRAATLLVEKGYTTVYNMQGGIIAWQAKNLEVITNGKSSKKACCANPNSKDCNPDGTCKQKRHHQKNVVHQVVTKNVLKTKNNIR